MMPNLDNQSPRYWYIQVPTEHFPKPKFHFLQRVRSSWEDDLGHTQSEIGEIIGMQYAASGYHLAEWSYLVRILKSNFRQHRIGTDDGIFVYESDLIADALNIDIGISD
jgi:hypothetical protein